MNLNDFYTYRHNQPVDVFEAHQYTAVHCLEGGHSFSQYLGNWISTIHPENIQPLEDGNRFIVKFGSSLQLVNLGDWLVDLPGKNYPTILDNGYFRETFEPLVAKDPAPIPTRVNVTGQPIYTGNEEVTAYINDLVATGRLSSESGDALLMNSLMLDPDVSAQIYPVDRGEGLRQEFALCAPYRAPVTVSLLDLVEADVTPFGLLPSYKGEDDIVSLLYVLSDRKLINDFILKSALVLPHFDYEAEVTAIPEGNMLRISAPQCDDAEVPLLVNNVSENAGTDLPMGDRFTQFAQLMKVKLSEMEVLPMDHQVLLGALARTLTDPNNEDQFIEIAIHAMCLHELGEFTVGELLAAHDDDDPTTRSDDLIDLGGDFTKG